MNGSAGRAGKGRAGTNAWWVLGGFGLACAAGLFFMFAVGPRTLARDAVEYDLVARRLAGGLGLSHNYGALYVHSHAPLYPVFLAGVYALGGGQLAATFVQLGIALATLALVYFTARRMWDAAAARATLFAGALYLPTAFYVNLLLSEILFAFFTAAGVCFLMAGMTGDKRRLPLFVGAGLALGLAALTRTVALANAAGLALWPLARKDASWPRRLAGAAALAGGVIITVGPWLGYVYARTGHVVLVETASAEVFYLGNNPQTPTAHSWDILSRKAEIARPPALARADRYEVAAVYRDEALRYIAAHPGRTAVRFAWRVAEMWELERLFAGGFRTREFPAARPGFVEAALGAEVLTSAVALLLFWPGLILMPRNPWRTALFVLVATTCLAYGLTVSHPRYNYPLLVAGLPALGYFAGDGWRGIKERRFSRGRLAAVVASAAGLLLVWARMLWLFLTRGS